MFTQKKPKPIEKSNTNEIMDIMEYMFDQDNVTRLYGIEQWKIGFEKGLKEYMKSLK